MIKSFSSKCSFLFLLELYFSLEVFFLFYFPNFFKDHELIPFTSQVWFVKDSVEGFKKS